MLYIYDYMIWFMVLAKESAYSFSARPQERRAAAPKRKHPVKKDLFVCNLQVARIHFLEESGSSKG